MNKQTQTYIGFDFGTRNIGVAVGQTITHSASPLPIIHAQDGIPNWQEIKNLIAKWQPDAIVVGVPIKNEDEDGKHITQKARDFATSLQAQLQLKIPVHIIDERLTTKTARDYIYHNFGGCKALQKQPIDSFAAKFILESWMNGGARHSEECERM